MDPRDESRLQDLLDDRLDASSAAALRERLEREPELKETWDELVRIRDLVRGPAGERAPRDFLSRVRAGIAALPTEADVDVEAPRRPHMPAWRRATVAVSAVAALMLVALSVRLMVVDEPAVLEDEMLDRASAPPPALDALREQEESVAAEPAPDAAMRLDAAGSPPGAPPVPTRAPSAGAFRPGDQVPPGLRAPADEVAKSEPASTRRAREDRPKVADRKDDAAIATYAIEAADLEEGRARLALMVAGLGAPADKQRAGSAGLLLRGSSVAGVADERLVLGSVILSLTREQADALTRQGVWTVEGKVARGHEKAARSAPAPMPAPTTPAPPAAGAPAPEAEGDDARDGDADRPAEAMEAGKKVERIRVRVLVVEPASD